MVFSAKVILFPRWHMRLSLHLMWPLSWFHVVILIVTEDNGYKKVDKKDIQFTRSCKSIKTKIRKKGKKYRGKSTSVSLVPFPSPDGKTKIYIRPSRLGNFAERHRPRGSHVSSYFLVRGQGQPYEEILPSISFPFFPFLVSYCLFFLRIVIFLMGIIAWKEK